MKKNFRVIILLLISILITQLFVSNKYKEEYKVSWMAHQLGTEVTEFHVETDEESMGLLNTSFDVEVTIKGTSMNPYCYVHHVQKAEYTKEVDGEEELVVFVEFVPVFDVPKFFRHSNGNKFETKFTYTINAIECGNFVYVFRCGDFEEKIYMTTW